MNASSDPVLAAFQFLLMASFLFWWVYLGGFVLGVVTLARRNAALHPLASLSVGLQLMPFAVWTMLIVIAVGEAMLEGAPAGWLVIGLTLAALLAGPVATVWLIVRMITGRLERP